MTKPTIPAKRVHRFFAFVIDCFTLCLLILVANKVDSFLGWEKQAYLAITALILFTIIQTFLLTIRGQTIGKSIFKMQIVSIDSKDNDGFVTNVLARNLLNLLGLTLIVPLLDYIWIFKNEKRCLHDKIAGTIVVYNNDP